MPESTQLAPCVLNVELQLAARAAITNKEKMMQTYTNTNQQHNQPNPNKQGDMGERKQGPNDPNRQNQPGRQGGGQNPGQSGQPGQQQQNPNQQNPKPGSGR
jgi:hypothetical protein